MTEQFWPNQNPIGKLPLWGKSGSPKTIVGVIGGLRDMAVIRWSSLALGSCRFFTRRRSQKRL